MKARKELYDEIVKNNLQEEVRKKFGRNYTQVSNDNLKMVINECSKAKTKTVETIKSHTSKIDRLIKVLADKRILLKSEIEFINKDN